MSVASSADKRPAQLARFRGISGTSGGHHVRGLRPVSRKLRDCAFPQGAHRKRGLRRKKANSTVYMPSRPSQCPQAWLDVWGRPALAFVVRGPPVGFVVAGARDWTKRTSKAWRWATDVRLSLLGQLAHTPCSDQHIVIVGDIDKPGARLTATKQRPLHIGTVAHFVNGKHPDPENVHKLVKDSVFWKVKGGDKWTGGVYLPPQYSRTNPRTEVFVWAHIDGATIFEREVAA